MSLIRNRNFVRRADKGEGRGGREGGGRGGCVERGKKEPVISARLEPEARLHAVTRAVRALFRPRLHPSILGSLFPSASRAVPDENADGQPSDVLFARLSSIRARCCIQHRSFDGIFVSSLHVYVFKIEIMVDTFFQIYHSLFCI